MSVNDIMDYVIKTPGNTNPAVIKSMVELENYGVLEKAQQMDEETLAMAKGYTDSQRIGYVEPGKVLTFSIEDLTEDSVIIPGECVKVTDEVIDLTKVKRVEIVAGEGDVYVLTEFTVERPYGDDNDIYCELKADGDVVAVTIRESFFEFQKGTYLVATMKTTLVLADTIHPIDPKYLPEGGVGYTEGSRTFELTPSEENEQIMHYISYQRELNLVEGKTYQIILNGVTYERVCYETAFGSVKALMIGKLVPDEAEPFCIYEHEYYGTGITTINGETSITVIGAGAIRRIDNKYLVNEVSLNGFFNTEGVDLANVYAQLMTASMQSGGALQSTEVTMPDSAFRDNCGSENQLFLKIVTNNGSEDFILPVAVDRYSKSGKAIQMSATFMMGFANMGVFEIKALVWFKSDTTLDFYVKVIPLTA